jgi:DNA-directed RNA polymerase subunit N (RpoN/RPB10)
MTPVRCQVCGKRIYAQAAPYRCKAHRETQACPCGCDAYKVPAFREGVHERNTRDVLKAW